MTLDSSSIGSDGGDGESNFEESFNERYGELESMVQEGNNLLTSIQRKTAH